MPADENTEAQPNAHWRCSGHSTDRRDTVRATLDADVVADMTIADVEPLVRWLEAVCYIDEADALDAVAHHSSFNIIHLETMFKIDVFLRRPRPYDAAQFERRQAIEISGDPPRSILFASAEDTILTKLEWYRLGGEQSDRHWAAALGVADLLDRALRAANE